MATQYTITLPFGKKHKISFAVFFWSYLAMTASYFLGLFAAFNTIGWFALVFLTVFPFSINGGSLDPWPEVVSAAIHIALQAISVFYWVTVITG